MQQQQKYVALSNGVFYYGVNLLFTKGKMCYVSNLENT